MKYLQDYINDAQTELFNKHKGFFAFSNKQVNEGISRYNLTNKIELVNLGAGLICPKIEAKALSKGLDVVYKAGIRLDIAENGKQAIIRRELDNHEISITHDITDTMEALSGYGFTEKEVNTVYRGRKLKDNE